MIGIGWRLHTDPEVRIALLKDKMWYPSIWADQEGTKYLMRNGELIPLFVLSHSGEKFKESLENPPTLTYKMKFVDTFKYGWVAQYKYDDGSYQMKYKGRLWIVYPERNEAYCIAKPGQSVIGVAPPLDDDEIIRQSGWFTVIKYDADAHLV